MLLTSQSDLLCIAEFIDERGVEPALHAAPLRIAIGRASNDGVRKLLNKFVVTLQGVTVPEFDTVKSADRAEVEVREGRDVVGLLIGVVGVLGMDDGLLELGLEALSSIAPFCILERQRLLAGMPRNLLLEFRGTGKGGSGHVDEGGSTLKSPGDVYLVRP